MAKANPRVQKIELLEILDEEFAQYLEVIKGLLPRLKNPNDKKICVKYIRLCFGLKTPSIEVKMNRNEFFKYLLKKLQTDAETQPPQYEKWFKPKIKNLNKGDSSVYWSPDKRTYVATKNIQGFGTLVYLAVSYKPELGWQEFGLSNCEF